MYCHALLAPVLSCHEHLQAEMHAQLTDRDVSAVHTLQSLRLSFFFLVPLLLVYHPQTFRYASLRIRQGDEPTVQIHARRTYHGRENVFSDVRVKASDGPNEFWYAKVYALFTVPVLFKADDGRLHPDVYNLAVVRWYTFALGDETPLDPRTLCPALAFGDFDVIDVSTISSLARVVPNYRSEDCARVPWLLNVWADV